MASESTLLGLLDLTWSTRILQPEQNILNHLVTVTWSTAPSPFAQQMFWVASAVLWPTLNINYQIWRSYTFIFAAFISHTEWTIHMSAHQLPWYYCDVVCYKERGKGRSIPLPLYLNQQALRLTVKMVEEKGASYLHSVPCSLLNERNLGQSSGVTWRGGGRGKVGWLVHRLFAPKRPSRVREIWRRILI